MQSELMEHPILARLDKQALTAEIMQYPKETIVSAFMNVAYYNPEQLAIELLFAEWKRVRALLEVENIRYAKIPIEKWSRKRFDFHCKRLDALEAQWREIDRKIDERLGIKKGEGDGKADHRRDGVPAGRRDDAGAGALAPTPAESGAGS